MPPGVYCTFSGEPDCIFCARPNIALQALFPGVPAGRPGHLFAAFTAISLADDRWKCPQCEAVFKNRKQALQHGLSRPPNNPCAFVHVPAQRKGASDAARQVKRRCRKRVAATLPQLAASIDSGLVEHLLDLAAADGATLVAPSSGPPRTQCIAMNDGNRCQLQLLGGVQLCKHHLLSVPPAPKRVELLTLPTVLASPDAITRVKSSYLGLGE